MHILKFIAVVSLALAALLLLGGCGCNTCDPHADYDNCCYKPQPEHSECERMGCPLFY